MYKLELEDGFCALNEEMFEHDALIFDGGQFDEVWLCHKGGEPYVGMKCKGFPNFGIWSVKALLSSVLNRGWDGATMSALTKNFRKNHISIK